jgi:hypothetical protein
MAFKMKILKKSKLKLTQKFSKQSKKEWISFLLKEVLKMHLILKPKLKNKRLLKVLPKMMMLAIL